MVVTTLTVAFALLTPPTVAGWALEPFLLATVVFASSCRHCAQLAIFPLVNPWEETAVMGVIQARLTLPRGPVVAGALGLLVATRGRLGVSPS